jgi:uncharacterized membrane protein YfcA
MDWLLSLIAGALAGTVGSMLGTGSGFILIPGLTLALGVAGFPGPDLLKIAVATTHGANLFTAVAAIQSHALRGNVAWAAFARLCPGVALGASCGALLGSTLDVRIMAAIFIAFALVIASRMLRAPDKHARSHEPLASLARLSLPGLGIGVLAAITGAGGLTTPLLSRYMPMKRAIGTSAAITLPIVVPAALSYYAVSTPPEGCGANCAGLIVLPAMFAAGLASALAAPLGTWLSHALPALVLRRIFAGLLLLVAGNLARKQMMPLAKSLSPRDVLSPPQKTETAGALPPPWLERHPSDRANKRPVILEKPAEPR